MSHNKVLSSPASLRLQTVMFRMHERRDLTTTVCASASVSSAFLTTWQTLQPSTVVLSTVPYIGPVFWAAISLTGRIKGFLP